MNRTIPSVLVLGLGLALTFTTPASLPALEGDSQTQPAWIAPYRDDAQRLIEAATADQFAWDRLAELTDTFGARLTGSENLTRAIAWATETMKKDGLDRVRTEKVMGPKWVRGHESLEIVDPPHHVIPLLGLGGSIATPPAGVEADVMVVASMDELQKRSAEAKGRIVLFDVPYTNYGETVVYRSGGARIAAQHGAVGMLLRSVGPMGLRTTHTGGMQYGDEAAKIPAAAISVEDSQRIQRIVARGRRVRVRLKMEAHFEPDVESANVIGEITGRERPEEIVLVGCHFDSWDAATGASDDAVGCIATWESLRLMKKLKIQPRRTVRLVLFTNEENGLRGGTAYKDCLPEGRAESRAGDRVGLRGVRAGAPGLQRFRVGAADHRRDRHAAGGDRHAQRRARWRRRGHRPHRPGGQRPDDGLLGRRDEVLHDSPYARRHRRAHPAGGSLEGRRFARGDDLRGGGDAGAAAEVGKVLGLGS